MSDTNLKLDLVSFDEIELLRIWKNSHRQFFFNKNIITRIQQIDWFEEYSKRDNDYIFVVKYKNKSIGCMGIRQIDAEWEVYNVILGDLSYGGNGLMGKAFQMMLSFALNINKSIIFLRVLNTNPAIGWYEKNNFKKIHAEEDHFYMVYNNEERE